MIKGAIFDLDGTLVNTSIDLGRATDYVLKSNDRVKIITDPLSFGSRDGWEEIAYTAKAKKMIKEFRKK